MMPAETRERHGTRINTPPGELSVAHTLAAPVDPQTIAGDLAAVSMSRPGRWTPSEQVLEAAVQQDLGDGHLYANGASDLAFRNQFRAWKRYMTEGAAGDG